MLFGQIGCKQKLRVKSESIKAPLEYPMNMNDRKNRISRSATSRRPSTSKYQVNVSEQSQPPSSYQTSQYAKGSLKNCPA